MVDEKEIQEIIDAYNTLVKGIHEKATHNTEGRAYGGIVRAGKGGMVESIAKTLVRIAWRELQIRIILLCSRSRQDAS